MRKRKEGGLSLRADGIIDFIFQPIGLHGEDNAVHAGAPHAEEDGVEP